MILKSLKNVSPWRRRGLCCRGGRFEVDAITAGDGNGWKFSEACLQESLPLWDGAECFVDHGGWFSAGRSVRDPDGVSWLGMLLDWCGWRRDPGLPTMATWCNRSGIPLDGTGHYYVFDGWVGDGIPIGYLPEIRYIWQYQIWAPAVMR